mmetsp:Transcript_28428/g.82229  ORF Transcript_28428/g.82229 Transcript_28428/m.82229 type:complete len:219 (+) Transcript_28428:1047-1703(+)
MEQMATSLIVLHSIIPAQKRRTLRRPSLGIVHSRQCPDGHPAGPGVISRQGLVGKSLGLGVPPTGGIPDSNQGRADGMSRLHGVGHARQASPTAFVPVRRDRRRRAEGGSSVRQGGGHVQRQRQCQGIAGTQLENFLIAPQRLAVLVVQQMVQCPEMVLLSRTERFVTVVVVPIFERGCMVCHWHHLNDGGIAGRCRSRGGRQDLINAAHVCRTSLGK